MCVCERECVMCRQRVTILKTFVIRVVIRVIPCCEGMSKGGGGMCERPHIGNLWPHIPVRGSAKDTRRVTRAKMR